jgi:hypothetical protein
MLLLLLLTTTNISKNEGGGGIGGVHGWHAQWPAPNGVLFN